MGLSTLKHDGRGWLLRATGLFLLVLAFGCGGGGQNDGGGEQASGGGESAGGGMEATTVDPSTAATVAGRVVLSGAPPEMMVIDASSEEVCHHKHESDPLMTETVVVNDDGGLKYAFVYVKEGLEGMSFSPPSDPVTIDQVGCRYIPHMIGIQVGQPLRIINSDEGVLHNIHAVSNERNGFNFGMPKVMETTKEFKRPEVMVEIKCDVHGWMSAYAGVLDHPFYAVTGENGSFALPPLPPGDYVIEVWHEQYGTQTESITVGPKDMKELTFTYAAS